MSKQAEFQIKSILKQSKRGWITKQVEGVNYTGEQCGGIKYYYTHIYRILHKWSFRQKVPRKVYVNTAASKEEKEDFKKKTEQIFVSNDIQEEREKKFYRSISIESSFSSMILCKDGLD